MTVTYNTPVWQDQETLILSWSSSLTDPLYYIYRDGDLIATTYAESMTFFVAPGEFPALEVLDSSAAPSYASPGRKWLSWYPDADAAYYLIEEATDEVYAEVSRVTETGIGYYRYLTRWLSDGYSSTWRITPIDAAGNSGTALVYTVEQVRHPDVPDVAFSAIELETIHLKMQDADGATSLVDSSGNYNPAFPGTGGVYNIVHSDVVYDVPALNYVNFGGAYVGADPIKITVRVASEGTPDTFDWNQNDGAWETAVNITGAAQALGSTGITVTWTLTTGNTAGYTQVCVAGLPSGLASAIEFEAVNATVTVPLAQIDQTGNWSFAGWWRSSREHPTDGYSTVFRTGDIALMSRGGSYNRLYIYNYHVASVLLYRITTDDQLWHHYAFTRADNVIKIYVDGALVATDSTATNSTDPDDDLLIRGLTNFANGQGAFADIRLFESALSALEIAYLYNSGSGNTNPLVKIQVD